MSIAIYTYTTHSPKDNMKRCPTCQNQFIETKYKTTFCCHTCQAKFAIKIASQYRKPRPKNGINKICTVCSKEFYVPRYRAENPKTQYCSRSCLAKKHLSQFYDHYGFKKLNKPHHTYTYIKVNGKRVREHRWIMEQHIGRKLERWEHVHHINDDSSDNRIENLEVLTNSEHQRKEHIFRKKLLLS